MGHTVKRCTQPDPDAADIAGESFDTGGGGDEVAVVATEGNWGATAGGEDNWGTVAPAVTAGGGW